MNCKFYGVVSDGLSLTVRKGPGTLYEIISSESLNSGDVFPIYDVIYIGTSTWASTDNGFVKIQEGRTRYAKLSKADEPALLSLVDTGNTETRAYKTLASHSSTFIMPTESVSFSSNSYVVNGSMRLFGLPYQFTDIVDHRYEACSPVVGREFAEKFFGDGTIFYCIPGKANFLASKSNSKKRVTSHALINAASGDLQPLKSLLNDKKQSKSNLRLYDFQEDYTSYMHYVNIMCRTVAAFLELPDTIDLNGKAVPFQKYDWKNYRWNRDKYSSSVGDAKKELTKRFTSRLAALKNGIFGSQVTESKSREIKIDTGKSSHHIDLDQLGTSNNFVMFYADPSINLDESGSNSTTESQIAEQMSSATSKMKEFSWLLNSAGSTAELEKLSDAAESHSSEMMAGVADGIINGGGTLGTALSSILSAGTSVFKGENLVLPKIYDNSNYNRSYSVTMHFRTPYGNKLAVYTDVIVPTLHCLALALPKSSSPNTYGSPFLIKGYIPGLWNVNLGIVSSIEISKARNEDAYSCDGLPMEVDVTLVIEDLYSRLTMSPSNSPVEFINNSSMIEYLATIAGLNLIQPQISKKVDMILNTVTTGVSDIDENVSAFFTDRIEHAFSGLLSL